MEFDGKIAVHIHIYYPELAEEIMRYFSNIPWKSDLYISTDNKDKATYIQDYIKGKFPNQTICVEIFPNVGRDVAPFVRQMKDRIENYEYICHIHSKRSLKGFAMGEQWRKYLYDNLLGSKYVVSDIFIKFMQNEKLGVIIPENMKYMEKWIEWGSNKPIAERLMKEMGFGCELPEKPFFGAGTMFWARSKAIKNLVQHDYKDSDFPPEEGQIDGTIMHAIERLILYVAGENGYSYQTVLYTDPSS